MEEIKKHGLSGHIDSGADTATEADRRAAGAGERKERRVRVERRKMSAEESGYKGPERRQEVVDRRTGLERRRGAGIRLTEERKTAEEGEMNVEQFEFLKAIEAYKKVNKRMFPSWTEVLEVVKQLGYRKVLARTVRLENVPEAPIRHGEDAVD